MPYAAFVFDHDVKTDHAQILRDILTIGFAGDKRIQLLILIPQDKGRGKQFAYASFEQDAIFFFYA